jgi:hypothetical protein
VLYFKTHYHTHFELIRLNVAATVSVILTPDLQTTFGLIRARLAFHSNERNIKDQEQLLIALEIITFAII